MSPGQKSYQHLTFTLRGDMKSNHRLQGAFLHALGEAKATIIQTASWNFQPQGTTIVCLLSESHASLHSWPEADFAMCDFFSCSPQAGRQFELFQASLMRQGFSIEAARIAQRSIPAPLPR